MRRLVPGTLFGQTLLILLAGLAVTLLAGSWIYSSARQEAVRAVGGVAAGQRIANLARLGDGRWLHISTVLPDTGPELSPRLLVIVAMIAAMTAWAVRRMTAPLAGLATAAERLGRDVDAPPLPETGSDEIRGASHAFNTMQTRLRWLMDNRTQLLAAISHDMRTQLMLLRLRAETVEGAGEREKMLATIGEMEGMLTATLSFAKDEAANETRRRSDLGALLASIVDDMAEAGLPVALSQSAEGVIVECKSQALRRAIVNLIDNAIKYGGSARAALAVTSGTVEIRIDDEGPGIPENELARVVQPFYRLEGSRSRDTGGMGLGLAIAASVVEAHGGELQLANREAGGLRASIMLPW
jgi:signal transduction histidine kinase